MIEDDKAREQYLKECNEECRKIAEDASKCKKEWDEIDHWASGNIDDEWDWGYSDGWETYNPGNEPFARSIYLKRNHESN